MLFVKTSEIINPLSIDKSISMHIFNFLKSRNLGLCLRSIAGHRVGFLFGTTKNFYDKTELILLITPHVIKTIDEAESVTKEITEKMKDIRKLIKKDKETWGSWETN